MQTQQTAILGVYVANDIQEMMRVLVTCLVKKAAMMAKDFLNIFFNQLSSIASVDHDEVGQQF